ncbi:nuclear transcription factor Y subunit gamma-like isoform X4 [Apis dorsata]|nr:nuclear transcription factor Y subunit gamma-like isoform X2 [Apis dorsata]XP_031366047.1 nuclear transcription factor Y subunit gamma-like isoform X3 [Apis dorsata]XP_031366048.1 nuclear transcription factor Y subunit gamma-like isoform X4 [Apis dorsata]
MFCEVLLFTVLFSICAPRQMLIQQEQRGILRVNEAEGRRHRDPAAGRTPMKMLQSLNALAGKISPGSPTDSNANKVHMHNNNNNNNNNVVHHHHHPYSKQQAQQPSPSSQSSNGDQKENT